MANVEELKSGVSQSLLRFFLIFIRLVLKETLENRGVLGQMKAQLRAEVFKALDDQVQTFLTTIEHIKYNYQ